LREREFFIANLLVRIHVIIVMMRWTGLAPWELLDLHESVVVVALASLRRADLVLVFFFLITLEPRVE